jgi:hypothetical protein
MPNDEIAVDSFVVKKGTTTPIGIVNEVYLSLVASVKWGDLDGEPQYEDVLVEDLVIIPKDISTEDKSEEEPIRRNVFDQNE